ncbi:hypothetical protein [Vreelandella maris]|jgi:copper chaperone CopZ|uniref:Uncharacterized protein n=1 Tax=Vreelandella maris TaxID=2729617 RepID=A0A7Y6R9J8_9GAMM|nr:hypothetical protein [Halomonas maris]NVF12866.1 hypothetical protein [Halomonas maris]|tara:strand:+ start:326 stop:523 length:198 start_codon:yes stop_codon:yes gene_type:complete
MAQQSLTFQGVKSVEQVNKITTALMMLDGVDSAEVGRHGADVDGRAKRETLINAIEKLKLGVKVS